MLEVATDRSTPSGSLSFWCGLITEGSPSSDLYENLPPSTKSTINPLQSRMKAISCTSCYSVCHRDVGDGIESWSKFGARRD